MSYPTQMKGVHLTGFGDFDKLSYREDLPVPHPAPGDVLIKVGACGMNNTDIWTRIGAYAMGNDSEAGWQGGAFEFPRIQGADIVGRIVAVGAGVSEMRLEERVMVNPTLYTDDTEMGLYTADIIGSERDGGFAEYVTVPTANAFPIESDLSDAELATFMISYLTAEAMLNRASVTDDDLVLITGASGGVGSALIQLVKRRGGRVVAVVGKGKESQAESVGANFVLNRGVNIKAGLQALGLDTVDVAADVVGGPQAADLLDALRAGGRFVTAGAIAGPKTEIDWRMVYLKHLSLFGSTMGTAQEAADLVSYITAGDIKPLLAGTYPLHEIVTAQQFFLEKKFFGKLVLVP